MHTVTLPSGATVDIRDAGEVPERLRRVHLAAAYQLGAMDATADTAAYTTQVRVANDTAVLAYVVSWSMPYPLTMDGLLDMPSLAYDEVVSVVEPFVKDLVWSLVTRQTPETMADPKADTAG